MKSTEALQMKVNYKINTLRGIFLCLTRNKDGLCPRTVFSQTQKIKNVCLKRRFQFVGRRKLQIENPSPFARKEFACFSAPFRFFGWPCFTWQKQDRPRSSPLQKVEHFPISALYQLIVVCKNHFCKGAKMFEQSFRTWLLRSKW